MGVRDRLEGAKGVEGGDAEASESGTLEVHWGCLWVLRNKFGGIVGVESVDTIMDAAQTRFFARAVVDPTAIGDLWPESINLREIGWKRKRDEIGDTMGLSGFRIANRMATPRW